MFGQCTEQLLPLDRPEPYAKWHLLWHNRAF